MSRAIPLRVAVREAVNLVAIDHEALIQGTVDM